MGGSQFSQNRARDVIRIILTLLLCESLVLLTQKEVQFFLFQQF